MRNAKSGTNAPRTAPYLDYSTVFGSSPIYIF